MQEQQRLYGSLYALRLMTRKYEFRDAEERIPLENIVQTTFPTLLQVFQVLGAPLFVQTLVSMAGMGPSLGDIQMFSCRQYAHCSNAQQRWMSIESSASSA